MRIPMRLIVLLGLVFLFATGCATPVLKQDIPVSTNPTGAKIYANGQLVGTTPTAVSLERNRDHILTLQRDGYRQEDVIIQRLYQKDKVHLKAIQSGLQSGLFFKDAAMGVGSSMHSMSEQEKTGEAFILDPPAVALVLTPIGEARDREGSPSPPGREQMDSATERPRVQAEAPPMEDRDLARQLIKMGAAAALSQTKPLEKKVHGTTSTRSYERGDGTVVTETKSSSVKAGINPAGLVNIIDVLFQ